MCALHDPGKRQLCHRAGDRHRALLQILHQGQDPDAKDYDGRTALMVACAKGHRQVVKVRMQPYPPSLSSPEMGSGTPSASPDHWNVHSLHSVRSSSCFIDLERCAYGYGH